MKHDTKLYYDILINVSIRNIIHFVNRTNVRLKSNEKLRVRRMKESVSKTV